MKALEFFMFEPVKRHGITIVAVSFLLGVVLFPREILGGMVQLVAFLGFLVLMVKNYGDKFTSTILGVDNGGSQSTPTTGEREPHAGEQPADGDASDKDPPGN